MAILETFLADAAQVIVDIYSRNLFEHEVFERRGAAELAARFGIELSQPAFWRAGLEVIEARIERYISL